MNITTDLEGAADFLNISKDTMRDLAASGAVPGAKIGKEWVFWMDDLCEYVKAEVRRQTHERRGGAVVQTSRSRLRNPPALKAQL